MSSQAAYHLPRTTPEQQGISSAALLQFVDALDRQIHELHSFMLLRHGCVVAEGWWSPYQRERPHMVFSLSKSFTSTAVGLALAEGHFGIDDPVLSFFPEAPAEVNPYMAAMRVRHLLSMSTGQADDTWASMVERADGDWSRGFFEVPVVYQPGTHFVYNTGATYMLSAIVQRTTGMKLIDYLQPRLFEPLGIRDATWRESPQGITAGGIGLSIKTEDIARFGQLYLQNGSWAGGQLLPEAWVQEATARQITNGDDPNSDWAQGYGYQFWRCRYDAYRGDGVFGQYCLVMPGADAVLAITGAVDVFDMQHPLNLVWEYLLPAMRGGPLSEDQSSQAALASRLSTLALLPVKGEAWSSIASRLSGRTFQLNPNALSIETLTLTFSADGCVVEARTGSGAETFGSGYAHWKRGNTALFRQPLLFDRTTLAASGAWTADDTYSMMVRLDETPFAHTLTCHFAGDEVMVEIQINVSLESLQPLLLTGHFI